MYKCKYKGGDYFEEVGFVAGSHTAYGYGISTDSVMAGQEGTQIISPVFCIPFAGLLLCVAIMPLVKAEWWESHQPHAVVFWSVLFVIPFAISFLAQEKQLKKCWNAL